MVTVKSYIKMSVCNQDPPIIKTSIAISAYFSVCAYSLLGALRKKESQNLQGEPYGCP